MWKFRTVTMALVLIGWSHGVEAHAMLDHANPAVGSTVDSSPGQVTLTFTQALEPKFSVKCTTPPEPRSTMARASAATSCVSAWGRYRPAATR